ncbi:MAG: hypothetical protein IKG40_03450 [Bacilli bacterium]|nr:hypothetical protein [Bacilli bacterium]
MVTKYKAVGIASLLFVVVIFILAFNITRNFDILDLAYLLFIIGCFMRYIYIQKN